MPHDFRFVVKAQRSSAIRGLFGSPEESVAWLTEPLGGFGERLGAVLYRVPAEVRRDGPWVGGDVAVADARLRALLAAWPRSIPLVLEFQDPSWHIDETFAALREAGAVLCVTELPPEGDEGAAGPTATEGPVLAHGRLDAAGPHVAGPGGRGAGAGGADGRGAGGGRARSPESPVVRLTGPFLYLRLRRHDYDDAALEAWARRIEPFLAAEHDVYAFFRHDAVGRAAELALDLRARLAPG